MRISGDIQTGVQAVDRSPGRTLRVAKKDACRSECIHPRTAAGAPRLPEATVIEDAFGSDGTGEAMHRMAGQVQVSRGCCPAMGEKRGGESVSVLRVVLWSTRLPKKLHSHPPPSIAPTRSHRERRRRPSPAAALQSRTCPTCNRTIGNIIIRRSTMWQRRLPAAVQVSAIQPNISPNVPHPSSSCGRAHPPI